MRVFLVCDFHLKYATQLAGGLVDRDCDVTLVSRAHDFEFGGVHGARRRYIERHLGGRAAHLELSGRIRDPAALPSMWRLRRAAQQHRPDVVHVQDGTDTRPLLATAGVRGPYAVTVHDPSFHPGDKQPARHERLARDLLVRRAGLIFVHAEVLREELLRRMRPRAPVVVVPHGTAAASVEPLPDVPRLLFFGRLSSYKGLDTLLDAMPLIWRVNPGVELTVAGEGVLADHPVLADPRVTVVHRHVAEEEVPALFAASTCVVLPYRQASQSGVGTLAHRFGRAIVATNVGGLPELVADGTGILVPPEDPSALADAALRITADPATAAAMGDTAARRIDELTGWGAVAELTLAAYEQHLIR